MTTFSIASILGDQNDKHEEEMNSIEEQRQFISNNSLQHFYNVFCKNAAIVARLNEQHHNKTNLMRTFPLETSPTSSNDFYSLHQLKTTSYSGNHYCEILNAYVFARIRRQKYNFF
jgi:hypothetical protein